MSEKKKEASTEDTAPTFRIVNELSSGDFHFKPGDEDKLVAAKEEVGIQAIVYWLRQGDLRGQFPGVKGDLYASASDAQPRPAKA